MPNSVKREDVGEIVFWTGDPDCDALEALLRDHVAGSPKPMLDKAEAFLDSHKGNLGECLALVVGKAGQFSGRAVRPVAANCAVPLAGNSRTGLDLSWLYLDPADSSKDHIWIQETKTTASLSDAAYIRSLRVDAEKLFGDETALSLEARLGAIAFEMECHPETRHFGPRIRALSARSANAVTRVTLLPTGVHDLRLDSILSLEEVRVSIVALGWREDRVAPVSISLLDLEQRLHRVARGGQ